MSRSSSCTPEELLLRVLRVAEMILKQEAALPQPEAERLHHAPDNGCAAQITPEE